MTTEFKDMQEREELYEVFREFAEISSEGTVIYSIASQRIIYISPVGQKITGLTIGSSTKEIAEAFNRVAQEDQPYLTQQWEKLSDSLASAELEFKMHVDGDEPRYVCSSIHSLREGRFILVRLQDIDKEKEHENYLLEYGAKKNTTLDSVVHFVSGALTLTQHLSAEAKRSADSRSDGDLVGYLSLINENSVQCLKVVDDLMREEHLKSPAIAVKTSRTNINDKVNYIVDRLRSAYKERNIIFTATHPQIIFPVDEMKLLQIVNNLLSNALKFSQTDEPVGVHINDLESSVIISVTDKGMGIPAHLQPFIFDKNSAVRRVGLRGETSNGIGLFISQILARLMNGRIWFESAVNEGSTFYLSLPKLG
jgi:two-component system sensor histidine kinase VicK